MKNDNYTAVIVDDEEDAREMIALLLNDMFPIINVVDKISTVTAATRAIPAHNPDIIFLDIELSYQTGFDLLDTIEADRYTTIFTTAYNQYAIKAIRYAAFDYLLKPISPSELKECIERITKNPNHQKNRIGALKDYFEGKSPRRILVPTSKGIEVLDINTIIRLEGDRNYTLIHSEGARPLLTSKTLKEYEEQLEGTSFFRIYQSHLINLNFVARYLRGRGGSIELKDGTILPVSREKKHTLLQLLADK